MRVLIFFLALANLLFFAYAQGYFGRSENPDAVRISKQVAPDSLRVVSRGEPPAAEPTTVEHAKSDAAESAASVKEEAPAAGKEVVKEPAKEPAKEPVKEAAKEIPPTCVSWAGLSSPEADRLSALLNEKFDDFRQTRRTAPVSGGSWWVFIPPLPSKADADKKAAELKGFGVSDFFVIQDSGPNRWAISLGVFSAENGANGRLAELKSKGVKSARTGARNGKDAVQTLEARGPAARQTALQAAVMEVLSVAQSQTCQ